MPVEKPRLLGQVKGLMRAQNLSPRIERGCAGSILRYTRYHGTRHPPNWGRTERSSHLTPGHLSTDFLALEELPGHTDVNMAMIYTHAPNADA